MKKRYKLFNELISHWLVSIGVTILVIMIFITIYPNDLFGTEFKITEEVCEKGEDIYLVKYNITTYRDAMNDFDEHYAVYINSSIEERKVVGDGISVWFLSGGVFRNVRTGFYYDEVEILSKIKTNKTTNETCEQVEVDELIACCLEEGEVKFFENVSNNKIGTTLESDYNGVWCLSEENLKYFEVPCDTMTIDDLSIEWLEWNAECENYYCSKKIFDNNLPNIVCERGDNLCSKYKFGNYTIETWGK